MGWVSDKVGFQVEMGPGWPEVPGGDGIWAEIRLGKGIWAPGGDGTRVRVRLRETGWEWEQGEEIWALGGDQTWVEVIRGGGGPKRGWALVGCNWGRNISG